MKVTLKKKYRGSYTVESNLFNGFIDKIENGKYWILSSEDEEWDDTQFETLRSFKEFFKIYYNEID